MDGKNNHKKSMTTNSSQEPSYWIDSTENRSCWTSSMSWRYANLNHERTISHPTFRHLGSFTWHTHTQLVACDECRVPGAFTIHNLGNGASGSFEQANLGCAAMVVKAWLQPVRLNSWWLFLGLSGKVVLLPSSACGSNSNSAHSTSWNVDLVEWHMNCILQFVHEHQRNQVTRSSLQGKVRGTVIILDEWQNSASTGAKPGTQSGVRNYGKLSKGCPVWSCLRKTFHIVLCCFLCS